MKNSLNILITKIRKDTTDKLIFLDGYATPEDYGVSIKLSLPAKEFELVRTDDTFSLVLVHNSASTEATVDAEVPVLLGIGITSIQP